MANEEITIYQLKNPITGNIRYVGKTNSDIEKRLQYHIYEANRGGNSYKNKWVRKLLKNEIIPVIEVIEKVDENNWKTREKYWISEYKERGYNLTNMTNGGDGRSIGIPLSIFHKNNISKAMLKSKKVKRAAKSDKRCNTISKKMTGSNNHRYNIDVPLKTRKKLSNSGLKYWSNLTKEERIIRCKHLKNRPKGIIPWNKGMTKSEMLEYIKNKDMGV